MIEPLTPAVDVALNIPLLFIVPTSPLTFQVNDSFEQINNPSL